MGWGAGCIETGPGPAMDLCNDGLVPSRVRITDPVELEWAQTELWETLGMTPPTNGAPSAPTAQPVSLHRHEMAQLTTQSENGGVKASLKADGVRYLVLLTQWPVSIVKEGNRCIALMYDRALVPYEVGIWAQPRYFERRTLLDGELVERVGGSETHDLLWLAFDIIMEAGKCIDHLNYDLRLNRLHAMLDPPESETTISIADQVEIHGKVVVVNHDCSLKLVVKPYVDLPDVRSLWTDRHNAGFRYDGILFTPVAEPTRFGKHANMFKWKSRHTVDVLVTQQRRVKRERDGDLRPWEIKVVRRRQTLTASDAHQPIISTIHGMVFLQLVDTFTLDGIMESTHSNGLVLECSMQVHATRGLVELYPIRHRTDKTHPNSILTIESTIENVLDHIEIEDLIQSIEGTLPSCHACIP